MPVWRSITPAASRVYLAGVVVANNVAQLRLVNGGTVTTIASAPVTVTTSTIVRLTRQGTAITLRVNGSTVLTYTLTAAQVSLADRHQDRPLLGSRQRDPLHQLPRHPGGSVMRRRPRSPAPADLISICTPTAGGIVLHDVLDLVVLVIIGLGSWFLWPVSLGGNTQFVVVEGRSMEPRYHVGDVVMVKAHDHPQVGDIIVFSVPDGEPGEGMLVVHRVHAIRPDGSYETKGDNRDMPDNWGVRSDDILGEPRVTLPKFGRLIGIFTNPLIVGGAAGVLTVLFLWPKRKDVAAHDNDNDQRQRDDSQSQARSRERWTCTPLAASRSVSRPTRVRNQSQSRDGWGVQPTSAMHTSRGKQSCSTSWNVCTFSVHSGASTPAMRARRHPAPVPRGPIRTPRRDRWRPAHRRPRSRRGGASCRGRCARAGDITNRVPGDASRPPRAAANAARSRWLCNGALAISSQPTISLAVAGRPRVAEGR